MKGELLTMAIDSAAGIPLQSCALKSENGVWRGTPLPATRDTGMSAVGAITGRVVQRTSIQLARMEILIAKPTD